MGDLGREKGVHIGSMIVAVNNADFSNMAFHEAGRALIKGNLPLHILFKKPVVDMTMRQGHTVGAADLSTPAPKPDPPMPEVAPEVAPVESQTLTTPPQKTAMTRGGSVDE